MLSGIVSGVVCSPAGAQSNLHKARPSNARRSTVLVYTFFLKAGLR